MGRYNIDEVEMGEDNQIFNGGNRQFSKEDVYQPKRSPIRRKDKLRIEEGLKPKAKRSHKKIQHRLKFDWQGE